MAEREGASLAEPGGSLVDEEERDGRRITEYEKERLTRIAANKARMESLGIRSMAASLVSSTSRSSKRIRGSKKCYSKSMDEDYLPTESDEDETDDSESDDFNTRSRKVRKKACSGDSNEDEQLMKAIALSLKVSAKETGDEEKRVDAKASEKKKRNSFNSRVKMTEDELITYFFQFDDGHGFITLKEMQRVASAHDFTWSKKELADMVHFFDSTGTGKLSLSDFREIASRCNMIQGAE